MSRHQTTKAKDAILGHARVNGWSVTEHGDSLTLKKKGRPSVGVRFGRTGDVIAASVLGVRGFSGRDKLRQVVEELNRE